MEKFNNKEFNKFITESVNRNVLSEAPANKQQNNSTTFNSDYVNKNAKNRPSSQMGNLIKGAAGSVGAGVGGDLAGGLVGAALGLGKETGSELGTTLAALGVGLVIAKIGSKMIALSRVKELKFPVTPTLALEYAKYAAAERAESQNICKILQANVQNAIVAYNQYSGTDNYNLQNLNQGIQAAQYKDRGQTKEVDVDFDRDFTDVNTGQNESKENKNLTESQQQKPVITSEQQYLTMMQNGQDGEQIIEELKEAYREAYGLWFQWTRYINVLVHRYQKLGLTWDVVINSNKTSSTQSIIGAFLKKHLGIESTPDVNSYQGKNEKQTRKIVLRFLQDNYSIGKTTGYLLKTANTGDDNDASVAYYVVNDLSGTNPKKYKQYILNLTPNLIQYTTTTAAGQKVNVLKKEANGYIQEA